MTQSATVKVYGDSDGDPLIIEDRGEPLNAKVIAQIGQFYAKRGWRYKVIRRADRARGPLDAP